MGTITVEGLGKAYKQYPTRWSRLKEWLLWGLRPFHRKKWVLKDISFLVSPGEAVGIIGINGAGKSTLLKLITGTAQPTTGSVQMTGRVAALLELGMGFHPDFTGRQNAIMAGQLLGIDQAEMERLLPSVEAFAEIGEYMDQPVRVYSSGMQVRLAFSVATAIRPDILIVDEALSVGDQYFQHKSFDRIRDFRKKGTTLLIVSHDKLAIQSVCDRALLLSEGEVVMQGLPEVVMDYYNALLAGHQNVVIRQETLANGQVQTESGSGEVTLEVIRLEDDANRALDVVAVGQRVTLKIAIVCHELLEDLVIGYMIKDRLGQPVFGTNTHHLRENRLMVEKGRQMQFHFGFDANLGPGSYSVTVAAHAGGTHVGHNYVWRDHALVFSVINVDKADFVGSAFIPPELSILE
jgi:lipopolysaccharide transport system ATP-binding protein